MSLIFASLARGNVCAVGLLTPLNLPPFLTGPRPPFLLGMESTDGRFTLVAHTRKALLDVVDEVCALL